MAVPEVRDMYEPVLLALADGASHSKQEVRSFVARFFNLSEADLRERPKPGSPHESLVNRVAHVFRVAKTKGIIKGPEGGPYRITPHGEAVLAIKPVRFSDRPATLIEELGLHFPTGTTEENRGALEALRPPPADVHLRLFDARPFDPNKPPNELTSAGQQPSQEDVMVLIEQARQGHHQMLTVLHAHLQEEGWTEIEEIRAAIDLRARSTDGSVTIFEAKTISDGNETHQCRAALAQLLEYRIRFGAPENDLCLVVDCHIPQTRIEVLAKLDVAVLLVEPDSIQPLNDRAQGLIDGS